MYHKPKPCLVWHKVIKVRILSKNSQPACYPLPQAETLRSKSLDSETEIFNLFFESWENPVTPVGLGGHTPTPVTEAAVFPGQDSLTEHNPHQAVLY